MDKMITFGDILDLMDPGRESRERVTLFVGCESLTGLTCSPLWKTFESLPVDNIGIGSGPSLEVWTHDPE